MPTDKIKVFVVEDSPVVRMLLTHVLNADEKIEVIGTAENGEVAVASVLKQKPDVVVMDVNMPKMDGFEATRRIMETAPLPILICSASLKRDEVDATFRALDAGAVGFVEKPVGPGHARFDEMVRDLIGSVKLMSGVKVVRRWARDRFRPVAPPPPAAPARAAGPVELVAIGASTGGPPVIQTILSGLPKPFPVPVLVVQHIATGFLEGMVDWLRASTKQPIQLGVHGAPLAPGQVYLAPDGFHMGVLPGKRVLLSKDPPENGLRPAVGFLFRSVAKTLAPNAAAVLLTGMGKDGAAELKLLKTNGAVTIVQDAETSIVHGMPGEAVRLGAATYVLPPDQIASTLTAMVQQSS
jgi:two-component system chemotaxis response regulator CheB